MGKPGGAIFASGAVLGVALGFVAGHLTVWSRIDIDSPAGDAREALPPIEVAGEPASSSWSLAPQFTPTAPAPTPDTFAPPGPLTGEADDGWAGEGDLHEFDSDVQYFPAAATQPEPASRDAGEEADAGEQADAGEKAAAGQDAQAAADEPEALTVPPQASPIDEQTRQREEATRAIIAEELPQATPQEQEIWFDVLRGLALEDVRGILRIRSHLGGDVPTGEADLPERVPQPRPRLDRRSQPPGLPEQWRPLASALRRAHEIHLHNLANAESVAYKRLRIVWGESLSDPHEPGNARASTDRQVGGARIVGTLIDMSPGELEDTLRALDLAVDGAGFLRLRSGEDVAYSRGGHLRLGSGRTLAWSDGTREWLVDPPIGLPEGVSGITIDADGRIAAESGEDAEPQEIGDIALSLFLDPSQLQPLGNGLYGSTPESGPPCAGRPGVGGRGRLVQGSIETSNVDPDAEMAAVARLALWRGLLHAPAAPTLAPGTRLRSDEGPPAIPHAEDLPGRVFLRSTNDPPDPP